MKVTDLKAELKKRSLPVSGPKPALIERLRPKLEATIAAGRQQFQQPRVHFSDNFGLFFRQLRPIFPTGQVKWDRHEKLLNLIPEGYFCSSFFVLIAIIVSFLVNPNAKNLLCMTDYGLKN